MENPKLGATGRYPYGKLGPHDQGELRAGITTVDGKLVIHYGAPITWTAMTAEQALEFARLLTKRANEIIAERGKGS
jgi:hypothetical protein